MGALTFAGHAPIARSLQGTVRKRRAKTLCAPWWGKSDGGATFSAHVTSQRAKRCPAYDADDLPVKGLDRPLLAQQEGIRNDL